MRKFLKELLSNSVTLMVIVIILMMIIPIPVSIIDFVILLYWALSMMILIITMSIHDPLEFSIFPTLLLVTTLFGMGINVSTTRNILANGGASGKLIAAFGNFVMQGNVVVGIIIYIIIVLMNFLVINKGAERVAEVSARFSLDAMPGKQMAIDSDLSTGTIDEKEAARRRANVSRESQFYGSMDGATKIVKGDAVMSLITTVINLVGGIIIGMVQGGGDLQTVAQTYTIATVGDGLVGQIPSLLVSTATGMIVTRAVAEGSLNEDISREFLAQPRAFILTGLILCALVVVPGVPVGVCLAVGLGVAFGGVMLKRQMEKQPAIGRAMNAAAQAPPGGKAAAGGAAQAAAPQQGGKQAEKPVSEADYFKDVNNVYKLLTVEPIELDFGYSLIPLADESVGGRLISRIVIFRRQYAQDMGFIVPSVRLRDSSTLGTNEYCIKIKGEEVARGEILTNYFLALESDDVEQEIDGIDTIEPAYGIPSKWIRPENREKAELYGYTVIDPLSVMVSHLSEVIKMHAYELITRQEVVRLVENLKSKAPELIQEVIGPVVTYSMLQHVLMNLLHEGVSIKDLETIIETMASAITDRGMNPRDIDGITEQVRIALKRTITRMFCEEGNMKVITLDADLERAMVDSLTKGENGYYLALSPDILQSVVRQTQTELKKFNGLDQQPVILVSQVMRVHFYHMIGQFYPNVRVLSFNEVANNIQIQSIGSLKLESQPT
ncbi:MAG: flagellar biosynthesis protein FlhA [Eubacteriales bacterium]|jgi:flagellar biosynthesis protein FlhA